MAAITEVMDEAQASINQPGVAFKGFVPAIFARMVNERFEQKVGDQAAIKVTAPPSSCATAWRCPTSESEHIESQLLAPDWPEGQVFATAAQSDGREAFACWCRNITRPAASPATASPRERSTSPGIPRRAASSVTSAA